MKRLFRRDTKGAASVIATLFVILIGVAYVGDYVATYVPQSMYQQEYAHSDVLYNEFIGIQTGIMQEISQSDNLVVVYTPVKVGTDGLPPFATSSSGDLSITGSTYTSTNVCVLSSDAASIEACSSHGADILFTETQSMGEIVLNSYNRYYPPETYSYEGGAFILSENNIISSVVESPPPISVAVLYSNGKPAGFVVNITQIQVYSNTPPFAGYDTVAVGLKLMHESSAQYTTNSNVKSVQYTVTSPFYSAWYNYFNSMAQEYNNPSNPNKPPTIKVNENGNSVTILFRGVMVLNFEQALIYASIVD